MKNFTHLHLHSTFSFQDGFGTPAQYVARAQELGMTALSITDHGNVSGHYKWYQECVKNGIKPILGCELYIEPDRLVVGEKIEERKRTHMTVLAKNEEGYKNLLQIVTNAWKNFDRRPLVKLQDLIDHQKGLIVLSGCGSGKVSVLLRDGKDEAAEKELLMLKSKIDDFYIEMMPVHFGEFGKLIPKLYNLSLALNIPMVATGDCHYVRKEHAYLQEMLLCIQSNARMNEKDRWKFDQEDFYLKSRNEMEESFKAIYPFLDMTDALDNTMKITDMVDFKFPTATALKFPIPEKEKDQKFLNMCIEGLMSKGFYENEVYRERMKYEVDLIIKKDFVDYFLVVADMVMWAKNSGILVGPARGSSAGSLVCFLLRITEVDPIVHKLIFERFIDINREDLPDIDVDFEDARRPDVKTYLEGKYGKDRVGQLATFSTFKGKSIISDFARIFNMPYGDATKLKSIIIERSGGDLRASFTIEDTFQQFDLAKEYLKTYPFLRFAKDFEGQIRNFSSHASGIIVSNEPITNFCAIYDVRGDTVISMDYDDTNKLGLTKFDILGLNTLTSVSKALKLIKERHGREIDIYNLPLDDPKVYDGFRDPKKLFGIFQFDGQAVNQVCRQIHPDKFEDLSAISALARPGPMHGLDLELNKPITTIYIERRLGRIPFSTAHPLLLEITKDTQGLIIYQEQVMRVMREIGKMSWKDTANIRKTISKSQGVEAFNKYKEVFSIGAKEQGLSEREIDNIWGAVCTFGSWAMNKSHTISYSVISYWTMWLKIYYPIEYYQAMTSTMNSEDKIRKVIKEYVREGFELLPIDVNRSKASFSIDGKNLRLGFSQIKGFGDNTANKIVKNQPYGNIDDFGKVTKSKKIINTLSKMEAFNSIGGANRTLQTLFGLEKEKKWEEDITFEEKIKLCPLAVDFKIIDNWGAFIDENIKWPISSIENLDPEESSQTIIGLVCDKNLKDKVEEALTHGRPAPPIENGESKFVNFVIEDDTDFVTVRISTRNFARFKKLIFEDIDEGSIMMIKGRMGDGIRMFFANEILCLNHIKEKIDGISDEKFTESELILMGKAWKNNKTNKLIKI